MAAYSLHRQLHLLCYNCLSLVYVLCLSTRTDWRRENLLRTSSACPAKRSARCLLLIHSSECASVAIVGSLHVRLCACEFVWCVSPTTRVSSQQERSRSDSQPAPRRRPLTRLMVPILNTVARTHRSLQSNKRSQAKRSDSIRSAVKSQRNGITSSHQHGTQPDAGTDEGGSSHCTNGAS